MLGATSVPSPTIKRSAVIWNCSGSFFASVVSVGGDARALMAGWVANGCGGSVTPVPVSDTDCGLPAASSVMVTVAVRALAAVGVNVRLTRQLAPATTVAPFVQVVPAAMAKSPGFKPARTMLVMLRVAVPLLVRVTVCTGLVVLRRWSPKARLVGAMVTAGAMPIPASDTDCGLPGASSVMVTVAVRAPVAGGVKLMLIVQLAPGAT